MSCRNTNAWNSWTIDIVWIGISWYTQNTNIKGKVFDHIPAFELFTTWKLNADSTSNSITSQPSLLRLFLGQSRAMKVPEKENGRVIQEYLSDNRGHQLVRILIYFISKEIFNTQKIWTIHIIPPLFYVYQYGTSETSGE